MIKRRVLCHHYRLTVYLLIYAADLQFRAGRSLELAQRQRHVLIHLIPWRGIQVRLVFMNDMTRVTHSPYHTSAGIVGCLAFVDKEHER